MSAGFVPRQHAESPWHHGRCKPGLLLKAAVLEAHESRLGPFTSPVVSQRALQPFYARGVDVILVVVQDFVGEPMPVPPVSVVSKPV